MAHQVETMAWAHRVPWHGLGVRVDADTSPEQMLVAAGLDWPVAKRPIYVPTATAPYMARVPGHMALTRETDGRVFDVVGPNWNPVQNRDVMEFFKLFCAEGGATMETAGALRGGQIVWGLANLGNGFVLPGGDAVKGYLLMASKHQAGFATIARVTPIRVVCANTFAMSGGFGGSADLRIPHTQVFRPGEAAAQIGIARQGITEFERNAKLLQRLNISEADARRILAPVYQPGMDPDDLARDAGRANRTVTGIMEAAVRGAGQAEIAGTAWGLFNGVTYYANHKARGSGESRMASTLMGQNNTNANRIYRRLSEMAGA